MIRLIIADDHKIMREGICSLLGKFDDIEIIGEAENGYDVIELAEKLKPEVIIMDIGMPKVNGIEAAKKILASSPIIKIIMLTMHYDRHFMTEAIKAGAMGYLLKDCAFDELINAIHSVVNGNIYVSHILSGTVVKEYVQNIYNNETNIISQLTDKERIILQLVAEGKLSKEIANKLDVSVKTVDTHRNNIMKKVGVSSIAELTKFAIKVGIVKLD
jgi:DNA-binding NarL/FixJ family response regulator